MNEFILLLQALLLIGGWLLFLRAHQELKAQAAKQSLTGETEELRRSVEALLHRLVTQAEHIEGRLTDQMKQIEQLTNAHGETTPAPNPASNERFARVYALADVGENAEQIAKHTGMAAGEVELVLGLRPEKSNPGCAREGA